MVLFSLVGCGGGNPHASVPSSTTNPTTPPVVTDPCAPAATGTLVASVKDYGAKGDGATDDTSAIQRGVNAVGGTGGTLRVPAGTYMVNATAVSGRNGIVLKGNMTLSLASGAVLKCIPNSIDTHSILVVSGISNVNILGGTLEGDRSSHLGTTGEWGMGLTIQDSTAIAVQGVVARECWGDGFYVSGSSSAVTFCSVAADHNRRNGMSIVNGSGILVKNSTFNNTRGTQPELGLDVEPNPGGSVTNLSITGCTFTANSGGGLGAGPAYVNVANASVTKMVVDSNTFTGNGLGGPNQGGEAALIVSACDNNTVSNNSVIGNTGYGILLRDLATNITVEGNTCSNNTLDGIYLENCAGSVVSRNTATGNGGWGIHNVTGSGAAVGTNTVSGNGKP